VQLLHTEEDVDSPRFTPNPDVVWRQVEGEIVLVHLETNQMYALNPTGARFWELLCEGRDVPNIEAALLGEFEVDAGDLRSEIDRLLRELVDGGLVDRSDGADT
jgi:hypothetical protein